MKIWQWRGVKFAYLCTQVTFPYAKAEEAYRASMNFVNFDAYLKINDIASEIKRIYEKIIVIGFSVGATLGWRCSENSLYDDVLCCYGSRIRNYTTVIPQCPVLLAFAKEDSFDVATTVKQLGENHNLTIELLDGKHGFADYCGSNYSRTAAEHLDKLRKDFLNVCTA